VLKTDSLVSSVFFMCLPDKVRPPWVALPLRLGRQLVAAAPFADETP
jgi:hypothetical protein